MSLQNGQTTQQDRIAVLQAIDAFLAFANAFPWKHEGVLPHPRYYADVPGPKYTRIVVDSSVHCFVDNLTGDVYKAAGWKAPAKGVRGNLVTGMADIQARFDLFGGYLYR